MADHNLVEYTHPANSLVPAGYTQMLVADHSYSQCYRVEQAKLVGVGCCCDDGR